MDYDTHTTHYQGNVTAEENKMKCIFLNPRNLDVYKIQVDGGLITDNSVRCDYIVHWEALEKRHVFHIELKGSDVPKAFTQLIATIDKTKEKFVDFEDKNCVIVCSRYPQEDSTIQRLKLKLNKMGYRLYTQSRRFEYKI